MADSAIRLWIGAQQVMHPRNFDKEYQDHESKYAYNFDSVLRRYMMRAISPYFASGNALEIGCFEGESTNDLLTIFDDVTVIEASQELVEKAKLRTSGRAQFICSRVEDVVLERRFDNVFLIHTLEHFDDPVAALARIKSHLSDDGRLFTVVPNANAASRQIAVKMGLISHNTAVTDGERQHGHRITYTLDTLERDARLAGLVVRQRGGVFFKPLANYQFDAAISAGLVSEGYLEGCFNLGFHYPDLCASIYLVCSAS